MRLLILLLLAVAAAAEPPAVKDFRRLKELRDDVAGRAQKFLDAEEYAKKPREEKMLIAFERGEKRFENKPLSGELVVQTCLMKWAEVQQAEPTEAGKRVLGKLAPVLFEKYGKAIEVPKDRKDVGKLLCDALDSDFLQVRAAAFDALKLMYRTPSGFMYVETMDKKARREAIATWKKFVSKQR